MRPDSNRRAVAAVAATVALAVGCGRVGFDEPDGAAMDAEALADAQRDAADLDAAGRPDSRVDAPPGVGVDANVPDASSPRPYNVVFITPILPNGDLGGLEGADATCAMYAEAGGFEGTFVAFLSTSTVDALDRLGDAQGWVRPDGLLVARSQADLIAGRLYYPPSVDHLGTRNPLGSPTTFTGTDLDGRVVPGETCNEWASTAGPTIGGHWDMASTSWKSRNHTFCDQPGRIFCFQTDVTTTPPPPPRIGDGRDIFVGYRPTAAETPDQMCDRIATARGLPGVFLAFVATGASSAAGRFTLDRWPWVNAAGLRVADSLEDLTTNGLWAPVLQPDGSTAEFTMLRTGAPSVTVTSRTTCSEYASESPDESSVVSIVGYTAQHWFGRGNATCDNQTWFYCLEQ